VDDLARRVRLYERLIERMPEAAAALDREGVILFASRSACRLTGYSMNELVGSSFTQYLNPEDLESVSAQMSRTIRTGVSVEDFKTRIRRKDGETRTIRLALDTFVEATEIVGLIATAQDVTARERVERKLAEANRCLQEGPLADLFPGHGTATTELRQQIVDAAPSRRLPVLIVGERGTGKALVAREVHRLSARGARSFVAVDCTAISGPLFESEMFGHEKGAFTGAQATKRGLFQHADGGTLFLDEIGELPAEQQAKLLVAIQERQIRHVGGTTAIPVDVRIIAATNRDLKETMTEGRFRRDLYDRIFGFLIEVPPLRERATDLDLYVDRFIAKWSEEEEKMITEVEDAVVEAFHRYSWPGNVRELELVIGRMVARARDERLTADLLPPEIAERRAHDETSNARLEAIERASHRKKYTKTDVEQVLERHHAIVRRAAKDLGISRNTFYRLMEKFGIKPR
jgi:PAS domain S-box-containing protein